MSLPNPKEVAEALARLVNVAFSPRDLERVRSVLAPYEALVEAYAESEEVCGYALSELVELAAMEGFPSLVGYGITQAATDLGLIVEDTDE